MSLPSPNTLSDADRLDVLRRLDQFREWHSLDDKRFCLVCGKIINGWQIQIADGARGNGPVRLSCSTQRCNSIPMDWVLPTDELVALAKTATSDDHNAASSKVADRGEENGLASRLRKFAVHLKLVS